MTPAEKPYVTTVFCDDVRQEMNGKFIYIGVYTAGMTFGAPPPAEVQLKVVMGYVEPIGYSTETVRFEIIQLSNGAVLAQSEILPAGFRPPAPESDDPEVRRLISAIVPLPYVHLEGDDRIRVRFYCGDELIHGGSLGIQFMQSQPTPAPSTEPVTPPQA